MKIKRILAFLLTLALVLGALPLAIFAEEESYKAPTTDKLQSALDNAAENGEANVQFIYDNELTGITNLSNLTTTSTATGVGVGGYTDAGLSNIYISSDKNSIVWKSISKIDDTKTSNGNNNWVGTKLNNTPIEQRPLNKSFVMSVNVTFHSPSNATTSILRSIRSSNDANAYVASFGCFEIAGKSSTLTDGKGNKLKDANGKEFGDLTPGQTYTLTAHVKVIPMPTEAYPNGCQVVYDTYVDGVLYNTNVIAATSNDGYRFSQLWMCQLNAYYLIPFKDTDENGENDYAYDATTKDNNGKVRYICTSTTHGEAGSPDCGCQVEILSLNSIRAYYSDVCYETSCGTEHSFGEWAKESGTACHKKTCSACVSTVYEACTLNDNGFCSVCQASLTGMQLYLDTDLAIRYYVNASTSFAEDNELKMIVNGTELTSGEPDGNTYIFTYDGVGPHQVGDELTVELYAGDDLVASRTDSIENYCKEIKETRNDNAALVQLVDDLLIYANAAGVYQDVQAPVNVDGITGSIATPADEDKNQFTETNNNSVILFAGVRFDYLNRIYVKINAQVAEFTVNIGGVEYDSTELTASAGCYTVYSNPISPLDFDEPIEITVTSGENVAKITYSVNAYAYYMQNYVDDGEDTDKTSNLAKALYRYGKSCETYAVNTITYNLDGGTNPNDAPAEYNRRTDTQLPTPTRSGYYFGGWYATDDFSSEKLTEIPAGTGGAVVLYAKWHYNLAHVDYTTTTATLNVTKAEDDTSSTNPSGTINYVAHTLNAANKTSTASFVTTKNESGEKYLKWVIGNTTSYISRSASSTLNYSKNNCASFMVTLSTNGQVTPTTRFETYSVKDANGNSISTAYLYIFKTADNGDITLGHSDTVIGNLSDGKKVTIRIVLDFENERFIAYNEDGTTTVEPATLEQVTVKNIPGVNNMLDWRDTLTRMIFRWIKNGGDASAIFNVYGITVAEGNIFE